MGLVSCSSRGGSSGARFGRVRPAQDQGRQRQDIAFHQAGGEPDGVKATTLDEDRAAIASLLAAWPPEILKRELDQVLERWNTDFLRYVIRVAWNSRLRTTIGRAFIEDMVVELNPRLLARHPEEVRGVLIHEVAHLVVHRLHGNQPEHGRIWRAYMKHAGESTRATHELDVEGLRNRHGRRRRRRWW